MRRITGVDRAAASACRKKSLRDTILIDTEGAAVGQINGLSVIRLGSFSLWQAHPHHRQRARRATAK